MSNPPPGINATLWDEPWLCTASTCPVSFMGQIRYLPSLPGNAFYLAWFALGIAAQIVLGVRYRTWGYLVAMIGGCGLEIIGYAGRIMLYNDDFNFNNFVIYLVGLTIGPALFSAAIYLCLARIIAIYGTSVSHFTPRFITCLFVGCDFLSLVLQAAGGAYASLASTHSQAQIGINLMIAGLSTQVTSTVLFVGVCAHLIWSVRKTPEKVNPNSLELRKSPKFRSFLYAIAISTTAILIRCTFRVAELSGGFGGSLANNQVSFMILDGAMMALVVLLLSVAHPGPILGSVWQAGNFHLRRRTKRSELGEGEVVVKSG